MEDFKHFFNNIKHEIVHAKFLEALKIMSRQAEKHYNTLINDNNISKSIKKQITREYKFTVKLINKMKKKLSV